MLVQENVLRNDENFEVVVAAGTVEGHVQKVVVIACYVPTNYSATRAGNCLEYIGQIVTEIKRRYKDPYVAVTGDFNQRDLALALEEFADMAGPTRGDRIIDRTFKNFNQVVEVGTVSPLQTEREDYRESGHRVRYLPA